MLRGLPFDEHDRLAAVLEVDTNTAGHVRRRPDHAADLPRLAAACRNRSTAWPRSERYSFRLRNESGEPADARAQRVSWEFFPVVRVAPILGRSFTAGDEIEGRHRVAIISYGFWQRRFGGSADVVGKTIELNEETWEIVGVLPRGFAYPVASDRPTEIYAPLWFRAEDKVHGESHNYNWTAIGAPEGRRVVCARRTTR